MSTSKRESMLASLKKLIIKPYGREPATMDELGHCVIAVVNSHLTKGNSVVGLAWELTYSDKVSNRHDAPITKETNWWWEDDRPKGYPGFCGRVWVRYYTSPKGFGSDPFEGTCTHTGTGGSGSYNGPWDNLTKSIWKAATGKHKKYKNRCETYSWEYKLFLEDWPLLEQWVGATQTWAILQSGTTAPVKHNFLWQYPKTMAEDAKILKQLSLKNGDGT